MNSPANQGARPLASIEAEQALLGAILINNDAYGLACDICAPADFFDPFHAACFDVLGRLITDGKKATPVSLRAALPDIQVPGTSTSQYLAKLASEATTVINAPDYARLVRDTSISRQIAYIGEDLRAAANNALTPSESLDVAWAKLDKLRQAQQEALDESRPIGESAYALADEITEIKNGRAPVAVIPTGLPDFDKAIGGGYRRGRLYVQAGRPGSGKTVLAIAAARRMARAGHGCLFFSLEIDEKETAARTIAADVASTARLAYRDILTGNVNDDEHEAIIDAAQRMHSWPLRFDCVSSLSMAQVGARARIERQRLRRQGKDLEAIFIDYLGLMKMGDRYKGNMTIELGEIARDAKVLAGDMDVAVILLAQLSRGVESREDKRPNMADLRQSGTIEEHADFVGLMYRAAYYIEKTAKFRDHDEVTRMEYEAVKHTLEFIIDKNRLGPTMTIPMYCDVGKNQIDTLAK